RGTYSLGRVQTPTLAMVCERFWENRRFKPETLWQTHFSTAGGEDGEAVKFSSREKWKEKRPATEAYEALKGEGTARITKVERKETVQEPPLLYDLTTLQKEANAKHGFTAEKTLSIAQKLYEAKLITYPRTGSRYIPEDVFDGIPALLLTLKGNPTWSERLALVGEPTRRSVDATKVTDHHALLTTGMKPKNLLPDEQTLYDMIVGRMLEAFSDKCVKDVTTVVAECGGTEYTVKGAIVRSEGTELPVAACSMTEGKTKPKPLHTEATLLAAMETCGKEIEDEEVRQSLKECGIGTPATRAAIIETLFSREYMVRQKKSLVPTEKGLALYSVVKTMRIADVRMTGEWEAALAKIERGELRDETFRKEIEAYTAEITT
ncbi:DNA topoisomerase, partial [Phocaeicola dorei]|uniref:DNA topoisomerase n=1 Tax=Phocaeicola dorei TaxID=357276 RepID=UPI001D3E3784